MYGTPRYCTVMNSEESPHLFMKIKMYIVSNYALLPPLITAIQIQYR